ncbi:hypothetical protein EV401DRAFT_1887241 [Pisolithus croceorrhizus]|nr:hypothetical protein EV401DRAFT_1887241 [Pisolithus croceorrhizus]
MWSSEDQPFISVIKVFRVGLWALTDTHYRCVREVLGARKVARKLEVYTVKAGNIVRKGFAITLTQYFVRRHTRGSLSRISTESLIAGIPQPLIMKNVEEPFNANMSERLSTGNPDREPCGIPGRAPGRPFNFTVYVTDEGDEGEDFSGEQGTTNDLKFSEPMFQFGQFHGNWTEEPSNLAKRMLEYRQAHPFKNVYGKKSEDASYYKHEYVGTIVFRGTSGPTYHGSDSSATGMRAIGAGSNFCLEQLR